MRGKVEKEWWQRIGLDPAREAATYEWLARHHDRRVEGAEDPAELFDALAAATSCRENAAVWRERAAKMGSKDRGKR